MKIPLLRRKGAAAEGEVRDDMPDVSQPMPLAPARPAQATLAGLSVTELSELEARALCAREDISVFWPKPQQRKRA